MIGDEKCIADSSDSAIAISQIIECPLNPGHGTSRRREKLDLVIPCSEGPDFIFDWMSDCVIQSSALQVLTENKITGFTTRAARGTTKKTGLTLDVAELIVTGWGGMADERSGIREKERCSGCDHIRYTEISDPKHIVNPTSWDGSDIFMVWPMPMYRFVTQRFVEVARNAGFSGISFAQAFPPLRPGVSSGFTPGRLSQYMPVARARLLGKELDID
jgi:Protein of unknown function (Gmx_para_CXXCG)